MRLCEYVVERLTMKQTALSQEVTALHAGMCSALADPTRILILYALHERERCVNELADELEASQPAVSRHLKVLRERGLVLYERQGANMLYSLADTRLIEVLDVLRAVLRDRINHRAALIETSHQNGEHIGGIHEA
jgi:DNA-binding transcriptional ArsR family regulator